MVNHIKNKNAKITEWDSKLNVHGALTTRHLYKVRAGELVINRLEVWCCSAGGQQCLQDSVLSN